MPRQKVPGDPQGAPRGPVGRGGRYGALFTADYSEGAAVGYKWFERQGLEPLFPFGFGLSYTSFGLRDLAVSAAGPKVTASLTVRNLGERPGAAVPQLYVSRDGDRGFLLRLAGWDKVVLAPGEQRRVSITVDLRLLARFDEAARQWRIAPGAYRFSAGFDAVHRGLPAEIRLDGATLPP